MSSFQINDRNFNWHLLAATTAAAAVPTILIKSCRTSLCSQEIMNYVRLTLAQLLRSLVLMMKFSFGDHLSFVTGKLGKWGMLRETLRNAFFSVCHISLKMP